MAAVSRLAEVYDGGKTRLNAASIAKSRGFSPPMVAKVLSVLSRASLVTGSPGPGGGFSLARAPDQIRLVDVFRLFERLNETRECPFGGGICGEDGTCPLHDRLAAVRDALDHFLNETTFEAFRR
jgi:Rrf2 family nitric oxide-sensitive transcriptional repressor